MHIAWTTIIENAYCINKYWTLVYNMCVFLVHTLFENRLASRKPKKQEQQTVMYFSWNNDIRSLEAFFQSQKTKHGMAYNPPLYFSINRSKEWSQSKPLISRKLYWMANDKCVSVYFYIISLYMQGRLCVT